MSGTSTAQFSSGHLAVASVAGNAPVDVTGGLDKGEIVFRVADRGAGIPAAERERLFTPFYRPAGRAADAGSAGLGLSIARRLAEAQGGTLRYSERNGGGATFELRLPAAEADGSF